MPPFPTWTPAMLDLVMRAALSLARDVARPSDAIDEPVLGSIVLVKWHCCTRYPRLRLETSTWRMEVAPAWKVVFPDENFTAPMVAAFEALQARSPFVIGAPLRAGQEF